MRALVVLLLAGIPAAALAAPPEFAAVRAEHAASDARLFDRHGELLHELRVDRHVRRLEWVPIASISPAVVRAVLQAEDRRFYDHHGVDWRALGAAAARALWSDNPRGASTLTMQLAGWLDPTLRPANGRRGVVDKWRQLRAAQALEERWSKPEILEAYLNLVSYRGELQGIAAAARGLFDKVPSGLDEAEALILAALLRAPGASTAQVAQRACVLGDQLRAGVSCATVTALAQARLTGPFGVRQVASDAPHVARTLLRPGMQDAVTALDGGLQRFARSTLVHHLDGLGPERVRDGAVLVVDNRSGEVLAYVGNGGNGYVDGVQAARQAGSTLKPFLYEQAIASRLLTAASVLDDSPVNLVTPTGLYVPQNYDKDFKGPVSLRTSLGSSLNVPAVRTLMLVGADSFVTRLRRLGFAHLTEGGDFYGYSLALGSAELSLWQLVNGYRTLANGGRSSPLTLVPGARPRYTRVLDRDAAFIVSDILADRGARSLTFGLENALATPFWSAVKTGTSKDMRDNWCIGYSDRFTVGVWVGNFDGSPMQDVSGVSGAAPVWLEVMGYLHHGRPSTSPRVTTAVVSREVRFDPPFESVRREWFVRGTEVDTVSLPDAGRSGFGRITYPGRGAILAVDPDIPPQNQRVFIEVSTGDNRAKVQIDGVLLPDPDLGWQPLPGRHRLSLFDGGGRLVDEAEFEVRGALPP